MKQKRNLFISVAVLCMALLVLFLPAFALADDPISMTEGDVVAEFVPAGTAAVSSDPTIAWVDEAGSLNALREGTTTVSVDGTDYVVNVADYEDGSEVVGRLKILARYNDSMQFYDGHVCLLFTSYKDGVQVGVPDLYGAYEISDQYYADINENIANGSNHTGNDTDQYFTFSDSTKEMTLNRGDIVTIGMYRGFDLSVADTALGVVQNSTAWTTLSDAAKTDVADLVFKILSEESMSDYEAFSRLKALCEQEGIDYTQLLDGVVEGGVCFNRELYNQKLEWDQYENVTYEVDITRNQLAMLCAYLQGNNGNFNILKNSCATVALRAWNAAMGPAYQLDATGEGIYAIADAPKGVRDAIVKRLPGYYLNNSAGVAEPGAGYEDETGWVYVSAPEPMSPLEFVFEGESLKVDEDHNSLASLFAVARDNSETSISYNADPQAVVTIATTPQDDLTLVEGVDFTIGETTVSVDENAMPDDGLWLKAKVDDLPEGGTCYVVDGEGRALPSAYEDGWVCFQLSELPCSYQVVASSEGTRNQLETIILNADEVKAETLVYYKDNGENVAIEGSADLASGTSIYVKATIDKDEADYVLADLTISGNSFMDAAHYDAAEGAYVATMPEQHSALVVDYLTASVEALKPEVVQVAVGDILNIADYASMSVGEGEASADHLVWEVIIDADGILTPASDAPVTQLVAAGTGTAIVWAAADTNDNIGVPYLVEVCESMDAMAKVTYSMNKEDGAAISAKSGDTETNVPYSGYLVAKGSTLIVTPTQSDASVISKLTVNGKKVSPDQAITVDGDTDLSIQFKNAKITGVPESIELAKAGDNYQLDAKVRYEGLIDQFLPVWDSSIRFVSSDPLVKVSKQGKIQVIDEVPKGGKTVYVTAYAGSSNDKVFAKCKVIVGDYDGSQIVGRLWIHARSASESEITPHGSVTFQAYNKTDLDVSYYEYYRPTEQYMALMRDYRDHPEHYLSDPALYNDNELGLENRESYFEVITHGAESDPETITLLSGEALSFSNYSFDSTHLDLLLRCLENGTIADSDYAKALIAQMKSYMESGEIDGSVAFDSLLATFLEMYKVSAATGYNPADGHSVGGLMVNREMFNQFRRNDSQMPNNFYTVEITADELAQMQAYLSDPANNYYNLFNKNCGSGAVEIWNQTLSDRPDLHLSSNTTSFTTDPQSLYFEIGELWAKTGKTYEPGVAGKEEGGGTDFYPRTCANGVYFIDVNDDTPHADDIYWLASKGITTGWKLEDGTYEYRGMNNVLRQDMAAFLYRLAGSPDFVPSAEDQARFVDVNVTTPHATEIWWLANVGISTGWKMENGSYEFRGTETVKRQDMAAFLHRLATYMGIQAEVPSGYKNPFVDVPTTTPHFNDIMWLASTEISTGWNTDAGKEYRGMSNVKRQDMAAFLHRLYNLQ